MALSKITDNYPPKLQFMALEKSELTVTAVSDRWIDQNKRAQPVLYSNCVMRSM